MKKGQEILIEQNGIIIIHQKVPGRELGSHTHSEHELFIPLQGELTIQFEDKKIEKTIKAGAGKMLYVPPKLEHRFSSSSSGEGERVIILISAKRWNKSCDKNFLPNVLPINNLIKELCYYLLLNPDSQFSKTFASALIESLIESLSLHKEVVDEDVSILKSKIKDLRVQKSFEIIQGSQDIPITELAKQSGLSSRNLNKLFMQEIGMTPKNLMIVMKVNRAKELLKATDMTITDISLEVGYSSLSKFISTFKSYTGKLPSDFRNS